MRTTSRGPLVALAAAVGVLGLAAASCSGSSSPAADAAKDKGAPSATSTPDIRSENLDNDEGTPKAGGKLVIGVEAETNGWNPTVNGWAASGHYVASAIYDPLATLDDNGNAVPYLAKRFDRNSDGTEWTITLRDGVKFHDGAPLDAAAVKKNLDLQVASPTTGSALTGVTGVEVVNPSTVKVTISQPWMTFPYILTSQVGYIAAPSQLDSAESSLKPVGTGPFVFQEWVQRQSFTAKRNPNYWQPGKPYLNEVEFRVMVDGQQRVEALRRGDIDLMHTQQPGDVLALRGSDVKLLEVATGEETFISLNLAKAPFDDPVAREAVARATDSARYLKEVGRGVAPGASGPFAAGQLGYRPDTGYPTYDLEKAKQLVKQYEAKHGSPLAFTYKGGLSVEDNRASQLLVQMWQVAGMKVNLLAIEQDAQIVAGVIGDYEALDWRNFGSTDPDGDYVWWHSKVSKPLGQISTNISRYTDPELDAALDRARGSTDSAQRDADYAMVSQRMNAGIPYIWLLRVDWALAGNKRVNGFGVARNGSISTLGAKTWLADLWVST